MKRLILLTALFVFAMVGSAFAGDTATITVTVESTFGFTDVGVDGGYAFIVNETSLDNGYCADTDATPGAVVNYDSNVAVDISAYWAEGSGNTAWPGVWEIRYGGFAAADVLSTTVASPSLLVDGAVAGAGQDETIMLRMYGATYAHPIATYNDATVTFSLTAD